MEIPHKEDIAWLAGIVDGDGCFRFRKPPRHYPTIEIAASDRTTVERIKNILGLGYISPNGSIWRWSTENKGAIKVAEILLPYLYTKRSQAKLIVEYGKLPTTRHRNGGVPSELLEKRLFLSESCSGIKKLHSEEEVVENYDEEMFWPWLSGLVDSDGCIHLCRKKNTQEYNLILTIKMTHKATIHRLLSTTKYGKIYYIKSKGSEKDRWEWRVHQQQAGIILKNILPYSITKKEQIEEAIRFLSLPKFIGKRITVEVMEERERINMRLRELKRQQL